MVYGLCSPAARANAAANAALGKFEGEMSGPARSRPTKSKSGLQRETSHGYQQVRASGYMRYHCYCRMAFSLLTLFRGFLGYCLVLHGSSHFPHFRCRTAQLCAWWMILSCCGCWWRGVPFFCACCSLLLPAVCVPFRSRALYYL